MSPEYWSQAVAVLSGQDPVLKTLIRRHGPNSLERRHDAFVTLARSIIGQQLSVKAARSIWQRLLDAIGSIEPATIAASDVEQLRRCGLSRNKSNYVIELATRFVDGSLDPGQWLHYDDESLINELRRLRGVGRWTAEMFLIFFMLRPNVLPIDDVGLQRAMRLHYNDGEPLSKLKMRQIAQLWQPWRTVATWTMWRSLDPHPAP